MITRFTSWCLTLLVLAASAAIPTTLAAQGGIEKVMFAGRCSASDGSPVQGARVRAQDQSAITDAQGRFETKIKPGTEKIEIIAAGYSPLDLTVEISADTDLVFHLEPASTVTVHPEPDAFTPDPSTQTYVQEEVLAANPGRPGVPISIPGYPAETASGGVKAPQYFAPGAASDHGTLIAQFFQVGDFIFPNNLSANAHGNGYADPNIIIPATIGSVETDGGAFNVRYGDHAVNLATTFGLRPRLGTFAQIGGDYRDLDIVAAWSPHNPDTHGWIALEGAFGNGYLTFPERRQQEKIDAYREFQVGRHDLTMFGAGYYAFSRIPGLVPVAAPIPGDTIDPRQSDLTHTALLVVSDTWKPTEKQQLRLGSYFRTYSLRLVSDFGNGLIRQSEFRTVAGGNATYVVSLRRDFSFLAGFDVQRDSIPDLNLDHLNQNGVFQRVTSNKVTIGSVSPFASVNGSLTRFLQYNVGVRRDQFFFDNQDVVAPVNSFNVHPGITSPKATLTVSPPGGHYLPVVAFSYGEAFHINDPRIGIGNQRGTPIARSRAYQLVATEAFGATEFQVALARVANSSQLAQIDPDTGLQSDIGPSIVRSVTVSARHYFPTGYLQVSFARANSTDRVTGQPIPEAPRLIWDATGTWDRLPLRLHAKGEFEYVGAKPLSDGFTAVPIREIRGSLFRSFDEGRWDASVNFLLASGFTGQTLEMLQLANESAPFERIVGVRLKSYASASVTYHFGFARPTP